jgi:hypothetical protein
MRRVISLALVAGLLIPLAPFAGSVASAAPKFNTRLSIGYSPSSGRFSGNVKSNENACIAGRKVTVYLKQGGRDKAIGTDTSRKNGSWKVAPNGSLTPGYYYAGTPAHGLGPGVGICGAAKSATTRSS